MSADVTTPLPPPRSSNPFESARLSLINRLLTLKAPKAYPNFPSPADHEGVAAHIRDAAQLFDEWLAAIGSEVRDNATGSIDSGLFSGSFEAAIDGNETYACETAAGDVAETRRAMRRA